ncbi:helix-turn-helix domain-containing protein [Streptomyces tricolor]
MDTQNPSVPSHARSRIGGNNYPNRGRHTGGLVHDHTRHTARFTVIGNHLTQHADLSLLAIGLACHIQSLPPGARVDIKTLAARFPEGATRIAAALRELETHGYLRRERTRVPGGRIVTRTISCNQPGRRREASGPTSAPRRKQARRTALPAVPKPVYPSPALLQTATDVLAGLRRRDPRLLLSATDTEHLAPGVAAWLERDLPPTAVREALTTGLPREPLARPAALLAHRLTTGLPPLPPYRAPEPPPAARHPLQTCDGCDRAFRAPHPGHCRDCRTDLQEAA